MYIWMHWIGRFFLVPVYDRGRYGIYSWTPFDDDDDDMYIWIPYTLYRYIYIYTHPEFHIYIIPYIYTPQGQVAGACSPQARDHHRQPTAACRQHPGAPKACRPPPLHVDGWGHARPQHPRVPATAGPPPRLAEAGTGPGAVEGVASRCWPCRCF